MEKFKTQSVADICKEAGLPEAMMAYNRETESIIIDVKYPYEIELERVPDFEALLQWVKHLSGKTWMTTSLIHCFIGKVCAIKGWDLYRRSL